MAYLSIASLAASSDVGTASLLDGDGDYCDMVSLMIVKATDEWVGVSTYGWGCSSS